MDDVVECEFSGILQVADEEAGPRTKREVQGLVCAGGGGAGGAGGAVWGGGGCWGGGGAARCCVRRRIWEDRESIDSSLFTQVKAIDIVTPLGKGQALQVSGVRGSGKTPLGVQVVMGQKGAGVRCVYAAVGCTEQQLDETVRELEQTGCMAYTTVVAATDGCSVGEQYAAICYAASIAERVRDEGGGLAGGV